MMPSKLSIFSKDLCSNQLLAWKKNYSFRLNLIKQLYTTQTQYVAFLSFLNTEIRLIFKDLGYSSTLYSEIFETIPEFYQLHKQILKSLEIIQDQKLKPGFILSAYLDKYIPYLKIYHKYFSTMDKRKGLIDKLKKQGKLTNYMKQLLKVTVKEEVKNKYPSKFLQYIGRIQLIDYLNKPFQRYHQYELILSNYQKLLPSFNIQKQVIGIIIESLKSDITELNQNFSKTIQGVLIDLEKKYGDILKYNHTYYSDVIVGYYSDNRILQGKLYILNGMLLLTQKEDSQKQVKRVVLGQNSWFHNLKVGNNNTNTIFVKGTNTHQIFLFMDKNEADFLTLMQKIFDHILFRNSWTKQIMGQESKQDSFVFKPLSVFKQNNKYVFVVFIKVASVQNGIRNFYFLNQLRNIVQYLNETHINTGLKSQKLYKSDEDLGDQEAENFALGLFQYLIPMLRDVRVCQGYHQLQSILKIVDYMDWIEGKKQSITNEMTQWLLGSEERLRLKPSISKIFVTINVWIDSCHRKEVRIGKSQRVNQIVQKIIGVGHSFEFTLGIGGSLLTSRVMDDDQVLYDCLKQFGQRFEEESNILQKGFNALFGKQEVNVYLRKYLYIQFHNPAMYIESTQSKLSLLSQDYLDKCIPFLDRLEDSKKVQLIALFCRAIKFKDIILSFVNRIYKSSVNYEFNKKAIFRQLQDLNQVSEFECFKSALRKTEYLGVNKFVTDCEINGKRYKLMIGYSFLQIKQSLISESSFLQVDFDELIFSTTPTLVRISTLNEQYELLVNGTYGIELVLERHIHIYNIWRNK